MSDLFSNVIQKIDEIHDKYGDSPSAETMMMDRNPELDKVLTLANEAGLQIASGFIPPELVTTGLMNEDALKQYTVSTRENVDPDYGKFGGHDWLSGLDRNPSTNIKLTNEEILGLLPSIIPESTRKITMLSEKSFVKDADGNFKHSVEKFPGDEFKMDVDGREYTGLDIYRIKIEMKDGHNGYLMFSADNTGRTLLGYDGNITGKDITDEKGVGLNVDGPAAERYMPSLDVTNTWEKSPNESDDAFKDRIDDFKEKYDEARSEAFGKWLDRCEASDAVRQENIAGWKAETNAIISKDDVYLSTARIYENIHGVEFEKACDRIKNLITGEGGYNDTVTQKAEGWVDEKDSIVKDIASAAQDMYKAHKEKTDCMDAVSPLENYRSMANSLQEREDTYSVVINKGRPAEETFPQMMEHFDELVKINESRRHDYTTNANPMRYDEALKFEQMANERDGWKPLTIRDKVVETISRMSVRTTTYPSPSADQILPKETQFVKDVCVPYIRNAVEKFNADREPDMHVSFNEETGRLEGNADSIKELTIPDSEYGTHMDIEEFIAFPFTMDEKGEKQKVEMSQESKSEVKSVVLFTRDMVQGGRSIDGYSAKDLIAGKRTEDNGDGETIIDVYYWKPDVPDKGNGTTDKTTTSSDTSPTDTGNKDKTDDDDDDGEDGYDGYVVPIMSPITREDGTPIMNGYGRMSTPQSRALMFGMGLLQLGMLGPFGFITLGIAAGAMVDAYVTKNRQQKENADLELVKQDGSLIKYIERPSEKVMLTAINQNPAAILHISDPTEKAMIRAFGKDGTLAAKVDPYILTEKGMISAVTNAPDIIDDLPADKVTPNVRDAANMAADRQKAFVTEDPENIKHLNNPCSEARQIVIDKRPDLAVKYLDGKLSDDQQVDIVGRRPDLAKDMKEIGQPAQSRLIAMDDANYRLIGTPTKQTQAELVEKNGLNVRMVNNPDMDIMKTAINQNPLAIFGIRKPSEEIIKTALSKDGMIAERLDKNLLTKEAMTEAVKNAPDLENSRIIDKSLITDEIKAAAKEARAEQCSAIEKDPNSIADMKNPCKDARNLAIEKDPQAAAKGITNPTKEEKLAIIEKDPSAAVHLKQDQTVQSKLAERIDGYRYIKEPTVATKVQYTSRFPEMLQTVYDGNPPASVVKDIVEKDPSAIKYVESADWDTISNAITKDAKAVAFNAKPGILADDHKIIIVSRTAEALKAPAVREGGIPEQAAKAAMTGHDNVSGKEALSLIFDGLTPEQSRTIIGNDEAKTEKFAKYAVWQDRTAVTEIKDPDMRLAVIREIPSAIAALDEAGITPADDEVKAIIGRLGRDDMDSLSHETYERYKAEEAEILKEDPPEPMNEEDLPDLDDDDDFPVPEEKEDEEDPTTPEEKEDEEDPTTPEDMDDKNPSTTDGEEEKESIDGERGTDGKADTDDGNPAKDTIVGEKDGTDAPDGGKAADDGEETPITDNGKTEFSDGGGKPITADPSVDGEQPDEDTNDSDRIPLTEDDEQNPKAAMAKKETNAAIDVAGAGGAIYTGTQDKKEESPVAQEDESLKTPEDTETTPLTGEEMESSKVAEDTVSDAEREALETATQEKATEAMEGQMKADGAETDTGTDSATDDGADVTDLLPSTEDFYDAATSYEDKDSLENFISNLSEAFSGLEGEDAAVGFLDVLDSIKNMTEMYMDDGNGMSDVTFASAFQDICDAAAQIFKDGGILDNDTDTPYDTSDIMDMVMNDVRDDMSGDQTALDRLDGLQDIIDKTNPVTADDGPVSDGAEANAATQKAVDAAKDSIITDMTSDNDQSELITQDQLDALAQQMTANGTTVDEPDNTVHNEPDNIVTGAETDIMDDAEQEMLRQLQNGTDVIVNDTDVIVNDADGVAK